jgi:hypothetical protein
MNDYTTEYRNAFGYDDVAKNLKWYRYMRDTDDFMWALKEEAAPQYDSCCGAGSEMIFGEVIKYVGCHFAPAESSKRCRCACLYCKIARACS